jgi:hypothetical protein
MAGVPRPTVRCTSVLTIEVRTVWGRLSRADSDRLRELDVPADFGYLDHGWSSHGVSHEIARIGA